jgi:hypothetical protein
MLEVNPNLFPPGGFVFKDEDGMEVRGSDLPGLVQAVESYRRQTGGSLVDVYGEVVAQICGNTPHVCRDVPASEVGPTPAQKALVARVVAAALMFRREVASGSVKFVKANEAYGRASICERCPRRKEWARFCPPCKKNATEVLEAAVRPNELVASVKGAACELAGDDLSAAVWEENPERLNGVPSICWRSNAS